MARYNLIQVNEYQYEVTRDRCFGLLCALEFYLTVPLECRKDTKENQRKWALEEFKTFVHSKKKLKEFPIIVAEEEV